MKNLQTNPIVPWALACLALGTVAASSQDQPKHQGPARHPAEMNKKFADPKLDVREQVERFESESRDVYAKRREVVRAVGLRPGEAVADIGAGTGLFTRLFAEQVGPKGTVYAVDIGPAFLKHIAEQAKRLGQDRVVKTVLSTQDSSNLPPHSVDVAFICDTYHHFEHPGRVLGSVHRALKPGGRLVIVDFDLRADSSEMVKQRARGPKEVYFREIADAGFERVEVKDAPKLKDDFFAAFRRVEPDAKEAGRENKD
jgi:ubiquinone/menaquinone biosynthesis C-methylase UbiE